MTNNFRRVYPKKYSDIKVKYFLGELDGENILIVKFSGVYGLGSAGNGDAQYMNACLNMAKSLYDYRALIIDLTQLDYQWGDMIDQIFPKTTDDYDIEVMVIGKKCQKAIHSLIEMDWDNDEALRSRLFKNIDDAVAYIRQII